MGGKCHLNGCKEQHSCQGFLWCTSDHLERGFFFSRHFLPKKDYFVNNARGSCTSTALNNAVLLSSKGGRACTFPEDSTPMPSPPQPLSQGCYDG